MREDYDNGKESKKAPQHCQNCCDMAVFYHHSGMSSILQITEQLQMWAAENRFSKVFQIYCQILCLQETV